MGRKGKPVNDTLGLEPAAVPAAGVMDDDAAPVERVGDASATIPADDEIIAREVPPDEIPTEDPKIMALDQIKRELDMFQTPGEVLAKARQDFDEITKTVESERAELLAIERDAHVAYQQAQDFANRIAKRRQALLNEQHRRRTTA